MLTELFFIMCAREKSFPCPNGTVLTGVHSWYISSVRDRKWWYKCKMLADNFTMNSSDCESVTMGNEVGQPDVMGEFNLESHEEKAIVGFDSEL